MTNSDDEPVLALTRPFEWGLVILCDETSTDGWPSLERGAAFAASPSCLEIVVRHAQDTDEDLSALSPSDPIPGFNVSVRCWVEVPPPAAAAIRSVLNVPSGRVTMGDAERWDTIELTPGTWAVSAAAAPVDRPEAVDVWFTGLQADLDN